MAERAIIFVSQNFIIVRGMTVLSAYSVEQQNNYEEVKQTLLSTYHVSTDL